MFNDEQLEFINSDLINLKLIGIPGGGKTRCIIEHINKNIKNKKLLNYDEYLICTFSRKAKQDFLDKGKNIVGKINFNKNFETYAFNNNNVKTIHSISGIINNEKSNSINTTILNALYKIKTNDKDCIKKFINTKIIYVDEAQDISKIQYDFIKLLSKKLNAKLCFIGDPNQNIYQFQDGSDKYLLDYKADKTIYLKINYRSTTNLINFYNEILPHQHKIFHMKSSKINDGQNNELNKKPFVFIGSYIDIENDLLLTLKDTKYKYENIAIISPVKLSKFINNNYLSIGLSLIRFLLIKNNIPFIQHYSDNNLKFDDIKIKNKKGHINLLTIHGSKGLEFDQVIILNYHITTMSRFPSFEQFNQFKYLWYVGMTRAKYDLKIYIDEHKIPFSSLYHINDKFYNINKKIKKEEFKKFEENNEIKKLSSVTDIINNLKPEEEYEFEKIIDYKIEKIHIFDNNNFEPFEFHLYGDCYGNFIESIFEYFFLIKYNKNINDLSLIIKIKNMIENTIFIPDDYIYIFNNFKSKFKNTEYGLTLNFLYKYKNIFDENDKKIFFFIKNFINDDFDKIFYLKIKNKLKLNNYDKIKSLLIFNNKNEKKNILNIWKLCVFLKSENNESGYLNNLNFNQHLNSIDIVINNIKKFIYNIDCNNYQFQTLCNHPNLPIIGFIDIIDNNTIIDIKFTKNFNSHHIYQLLLYYNNKFPHWNNFTDIKIFNLYQGIIYNIDINKNNINNYEFNKLLCKILNTKMINNIFLYDLKTTSHNINNSKIIFRHFLEYNLNFIASSGNLSNNSNDDILKFNNEIKDIFKYCDDPLFISNHKNDFYYLIMKKYKLFNDHTKFICHYKK